MKKLIDILEHHIPNYEAMTEDQQDDLLVAVEEWAKVQSKATKMPTFETIRNTIANCSEELAADLIYEAFTTAYEPLSELYKDEQACQKVFKFVFPIWDFEEALRAPNKDCLNFFGITDQGVRVNTMSIWNDGIIHFGVINGIHLRCVKYFALVDFIRSLGYAPNPDQPVQKDADPIHRAH